MTVLQPRTLDTTITLPQTAFNPPIGSGNPAVINAPAAGSDPAIQYVGPQNVTVKGRGTYIIAVWATFQGTANYQLRIEIQINGVTVQDTTSIGNTLSSQNAPYERVLFHRAVLNHGDVIKICGGYAGNPVNGRLLVAKETI